MVKAVLLAVTAAALGYAQAQPAGALEGHVTSLNGEPLKKVTLRLQKLQTAPAGQVLLINGAAQTPLLTAESDDAGNFVFEQLDPGSYLLNADRTGYLRQSYIAGATGVSNSLTIRPGQRTSGIALKMTPQAMIGGKVTDEDGDPYPNARVMLGRWSYSTGRKQFVPAGNVGTAADGTFVIGGLSAGRYYLNVNDQSVINGREEAYVTTYYPGVTDASAAVPIEVGAGKDLRGIEVRMRKSRVFRISGKVIDSSTGAPPPNMSVNLYPEDAADLNGARPSAQVRDGAFEFQRLVPGSYIVQANPMTIRAVDGTMTTISLVGRQVVAVGNGNVDDVVLRLGAGAQVTGKMVTEGAAPPAPAARPRILLTPTEGVTPGAGNAQVNEDGSFLLKNLTPAKYRVSVVPMPPGTYLKSVRFGGVDITKTGLDVTSGNGGNLEMTLSSHPADVRGVARGATSVTIWSADSDVARTAGASIEGTFSFMGLPPGEYHIAAWEQVETGLANVPGFRNAFNSKTAAVRLSEDSHESVEVPLIGRDAIEAEAAKFR